MENDLKQHLKEKFKENFVIINGNEFVSIDVLTEAVYNLAISDAVIGALALRYGNIEVSNDDIINYMSEYSDRVEVKFEEDKYIARRLSD
jgi:calcineurin-like phosphoesterase